MKTIKTTIVSLSLAALFALAGCGKKSPVAMMEGFADDMCKCKDAACVTDVQKKMTDATKDMKGDSEKPSDEDMKKVMAAMEKMTKCAEKAMGTGEKK